MISKSDVPWIDPPKGSISFNLKEVYYYLESFKIDQTKELLADLQYKIEAGSAHEKSEYYYLYGKLESISGRPHLAIAHHKLASELSPGIIKYDIAYLETRIPAYFDKVTISNLLKETNEKSGKDYYLFRAKLFSMQKDFKSAFSELRKVNIEDKYIYHSIVLNMSENSKACIKFSNKAIKLFKPSARRYILLKCIIARSYFDLGSIDIPEGHEIPFVGLPQMKPELLKKSWDEVKTAWMVAKKNYFPPEIESILDVSTILCLYFDEAEIIIEYLFDIIKLRPSAKVYANTLLPILLQENDLERLSQLFDSLEITSDVIVSKAVYLYRKNEKRETVNIIKDNLAFIIGDKPRNYQLAITIAAHCANDLGLKNDRNELLESLNKIPHYEDLIAIFKFISVIDNNPLEKESALESLYNRFESGSRYNSLMYQLIGNLKPDTIDNSKRIIKICNELLKKHDLLLPDYLKYCHAMIVVEDWNGALNISSKALIRFTNNPRLLAYKALALDELGESPTSIKIIEDTYNEENYEATAFEIFLNIYIRCGLAEKAKNILNRILEKTDDRETKLHLLKLSFNIENLIDSGSKNLQPILERYGRLCNKKDETEEGVFILLSISLFHSMNDQVDDTFANEFIKRRDNYIRKFPESKIVRMVAVQGDETGISRESFIQQLEAASGLDDNQIKWFKKNANLLESGEFPVPFIVRHNTLINIDDPFILWEYCKALGYKKKKYRLEFDIERYEAKHLESFYPKIPLIDEVTLTILYDVNLLDLFFWYFKFIALSKSTIHAIQTAAQIHTTFYKSNKLKEILNKLTSNYKRVVSISGDNSLNDQSAYFPALYIKSSFKPSYHFLYSDDVYLRYFVCEHSTQSQSATTVDFIETLVSEKIISNKDAARRIALLCSFNLNKLPIRYYYVLIVLNNKIKENDSFDAILTTMSEDIHFSYFFNGICDFLKGYKGGLLEIGNFMSYMILREEGIIVIEKVMVAIWYLWFSRYQFSGEQKHKREKIIVDSFISTCYAIKIKTGETILSSSACRILWRLLFDLLPNIYKDRMSQQKSQKIIVDISKMIAEINTPKIKINFDIISSGLTRGTSEHDLFRREYTGYLVKLHVKEHVANN